jgi:pyruvate formate lyase activating enzyme
MKKILLDELVQILRPRLGFLDGVNIEGGEPLLHKGLVDFLQELKFHGSLVKIKTNASKPRLIKLLNDKHLVDYYSVFIPAPFSKYKEIVRHRIKVEDIITAIQIVRKSGINHEFRVKPVPGIIGESELLEIAGYLVGAPRFVIERFKPELAMDPEIRNTAAFSDVELKDLRDLVSPYFNEIAMYF